MENIGTEGLCLLKKAGPFSIYGNRMDNIFFVAKKETERFKMLTKYTVSDKVN